VHHREIIALMLAFARPNTKVADERRDRGIGREGQDHQ
jgi:hypothetical protein